jgi:uncharacterized protein
MSVSAMANAQPDNSSRTLSSPTQSGDRNPTIDILRGFALFGILLVNFPGSEAARSGAVDDVVSKLLTILVSGNFYTTFSFLFGLGFALQLLRAQSRGQRVVPVYIRRMLMLFLIGLGHAVLIWSGDVLLIYAFMGFFLIPFRNRSAKVLLSVAVLALAADYFVSISDKPFLVRDLVPRRVDPELEQESKIQETLAYDKINDAYRRLEAATKSGSYPEAVAVRFDVWRLSNRDTSRYIWFTSFAMFLLGMFAGRYGLIRSPPVRSVLIRRVMWISLPIWLGLGAATTFGPELLGSFYYKVHWKLQYLAWLLHYPAGSLFYISAILSFLALRPDWIVKLAPLASVGRIALTIYLLQSVAGTLLYYGYGLGLQYELGHLSSVFLAVVVFALQAVLSHWWLRHFRFGPVEWFWRSLTYGGLQPMRLKISVSGPRHSH